MLLSLELWVWVAIGAGVAVVVAGFGSRWGISDYLLDRFG